jgi:hypothetical protein
MAALGDATGERKNPRAGTDKQDHNANAHDPCIGGRSAATTALALGAPLIGFSYD